jgi:hypothetical protein
MLSFAVNTNLRHLFEEVYHFLCNDGVYASRQGVAMRFVFKYLVFKDRLIAISTLKMSSSAAKAVELLGVN